MHIGGEYMSWFDSKEALTDLTDFFEILEREIMQEISLVDKIRLTQYYADSGLAFEHEGVLKPIEFFEQSEGAFHFIQNGEFCTYEEINTSRPFWAIMKIAGQSIEPFTHRRLHDLYYHYA